MAINTNLLPYKVKIRIFPQKHTLTRTAMTTSFTVSVEKAHFLIFPYIFLHIAAFLDNYK